MHYRSFLILGSSLVLLFFAAPSTLEAKGHGGGHGGGHHGGGHHGGHHGGGHHGGHHGNHHNGHHGWHNGDGWNNGWDGGWGGVYWGGSGINAIDPFYDNTYSYPSYYYTDPDSSTIYYEINTD